MLVSNYLGFEFYYFEDAWPFYIILVFLFIIETLLSVSLYVVEDFNEANLLSIKEKLSASDEKSLQKFLKNKNRFINRFHAALISAHMFVILLAANIIIDVTDHLSNYTKKHVADATGARRRHGLQMTPVARLRRAARVICNLFGGCDTARSAFSRQCTATRRAADGTFPGVSCGQPRRPLYVTA